MKKNKLFIFLLITAIAGTAISLLFWTPAGDSNSSIVKASFLSSCPSCPIGEVCYYTRAYGYKCCSKGLNISGCPICSFDQRCYDVYEDSKYQYACCYECTINAECATNQVCFNRQCCTPNTCGTRQCGTIDQGCGLGTIECGIGCSGCRSCDSWGTCVDDNSKCGEGSYPCGKCSYGTCYPNQYACSGCQSCLDSDHDGKYECLNDDAKCGNCATCEGFGYCQQRDSMCWDPFNENCPNCRTGGCLSCKVNAQGEYWCEDDYTLCGTCGYCSGGTCSPLFGVCQTCEICYGPISYEPPFGEYRSVWPTYWCIIDRSKCLEPGVCYNNQCCIPKTCQELGVECGSVSDTCGGTINCGGCGPCGVCSAGKCSGSQALCGAGCQTCQKISLNPPYYKCQDDNTQCSGCQVCKSDVCKSGEYGETGKELKIIKNGKVLAGIDSNGSMMISGFLKKGSPPDGFKIKGAGGSPVAGIDSNGNLWLSGTLYQNSTPVPTGKKELLVKGAVGNLAMFDDSGNLYLRCGFIQDDWWVPQNPVGSSPSTWDGWSSYQIPRGGSSDTIYAHNFGFTLPTNAKITGIKVTVDRGASPSSCITDYTVRLVKNGVAVGDNKADQCDNCEWPYYWWDRTTSATYGGNGDMWGISWTASDINSLNFGFHLSAQNDGDIEGFTCCEDYQYGGECQQEPYATAYVNGLGIDIYYATKQLPEAQPREATENCFLLSMNPHTTMSFKLCSLYIY